MHKEDHWSHPESFRIPMVTLTCMSGTIIEPKGSFTYINRVNIDMFPF